MNSSIRSVLCVTLTLLLLPACEKPETPVVEPVAPAVAPSSSGAALPSASAAAALAKAPAAETPFPGQDPAVGNWVETSAYKFKVTGVSRCATPEGVEVPPDRPLRVAVAVEIFSKYDQLMVAARDVHLEKDGVIIDADKQAKPSAGCTTPLATRRLNHDQAGAGLVFFQVADEAFLDGASVAFEPTRWGSAPRAQVKLGKDPVKAGPG